MCNHGKGVLRKLELSLWGETKRGSKKMKRFCCLCVCPTPGLIGIMRPLLKDLLTKITVKYEILIINIQSPTHFWAFFMSYFRLRYKETWQKQNVTNIIPYSLLLHLSFLLLRSSFLLKCTYIYSCTSIYKIWPSARHHWFFLSSLHRLLKNWE